MTGTLEPSRFTGDHFTGNGTATPPPMSYFALSASVQQASIGTSATSLSDASLQALALASREPGRLMLSRVQTSCVAGAGTLVGDMKEHPPYCPSEIRGPALHT